ncbi:MAG: Histidine kinase [Verrucomicrobiales bacterium]|nr:Histidine kinase [Verrucomicrobiales bacterium]
MALAEDAQGSVWIGTDGGGLNCWRDGKAVPDTPSYVLDNQTVSALALPADGSLWLGTAGGGVFHIDKGKVSHLTTAQGLPGLMVTSLCGDSKGRLWIGTLDGGPACLDGTRITRPPAIAALAHQPVTGILEDAAGGLWFGTKGQGLARLDAGTGTLVWWTRSEGLASGFIRTLHEAPAGTVWAGTNGGLTRWRNGRLFNFTGRHGLPNVVVSQILDDGADNLWLGTSGGVLRVSLDSFEAVASGRHDRLQILALGTENGLPSLECTGGSQPAGLRTRDGRLCFGTVGGLAVIQPRDFQGPSEFPPVVIESWTSGSATVRLERGGGTGPLEVPPGTARLGFEFTALSPGSPERIRFRYRLAGLEESWVQAEPGAERTATYTQPAPGSYVFEVMASADNGPWSGVPARIPLRVLAPWWRQPWAAAAGVLLAVASVAGLARALTRRRLQRRLREVERQFTLERERSRIARDIHDDLGANLTQISLLSALGQEQRHEPEKARAQFAAIAATSGELVQAMDAIVWAVNPSQDTLESLARYLVRFAGDFFEHTQVRLRLDVPPQLPRADLSSEVRHNLFLAAKEALHNALHHAGAGEVRLSLSVEGRTPDITTTAGRNAHGVPGGLMVEIEDDGCGFTPERVADQGGNGLGNMHHRLTECGGGCVIDSIPGRGTRVQLRIPLCLTPPQPRVTHPASLRPVP